MTKTFNVMNRGEDAALVYLVLAKCGVLGWADWDIETSVEAGQDQNNHGVCGARGVDTAQRCISDSGGTCAVQVMTDRRHSPRLPCVSFFFYASQDFLRETLVATGVRLVFIARVGRGAHGQH